MSDSYPIDLHPPRDWQVFEGFCRDLEWGRLCWAGGDLEGAREHLTKARGIAEATGYRRRGRAVAELAGALAG